MFFISLRDLLIQRFGSKYYIIKGFDRTPSGETIVYYMQRPQGPVFRKAAKDIVIDSDLRRHFDYCDYTSIVSEAQRDRFFEASACSNF